MDRPLHRSSLQVKSIRCGKPNCQKCPHGPYVYRAWRGGDGKVRSEYIGRLVPPAGESKRWTVGGPNKTHPHRPGDTVRFSTTFTPFWGVIVAKKARWHEDQPPMKVEAIGWARFGPKRQVYPYVTLLTAEGLPVYHPYDSSLTFADPAGRLDRRFPIPLLAT